MNPEILAPAGSPEALYAAVRNGADAVYFGAAKYQARAYAQNFEGKGLSDAVDFCKRAGVKVHLTVNTLATDRELTEMVPFLREVCEMGVDALIIQDLGLVSLVRELCPGMQIHASTQMTVHSLAGAQFAAALGANRVVLARELPREELCKIAREAPVETEIFVHGSLCVCHSGRCYMSSVIGRRSGNRGRCAQPCRMDYSCEAGQGGLLSLKDLSLLPRLEEVLELGVTALKIEGRMKRPEYVAAVTRTLVSAVKEGKAPTSGEMDRLERIFSRGGFTDGYFTGRRQGMHGVRPRDVPEETELLKKERQSYEKERPRVGLRLEFSAQRGAPCSLTLQDGEGRRVCVCGPEAELAQARGTTEEEISEACSKLGDTPYFVGDRALAVEQGLYLPKSVLNSLRRQAVALLDEARLRRDVALFSPRDREKVPNRKGAVRLRVVVDALSQIPKDTSVLERLFVPLHLAGELGAVECPWGVRLPPVFFDGEQEEVLRWLAVAQKRGATCVLCQNIGQAELLKNCGLSLCGDYALNVFNSGTVQTLRERGLAEATLSAELNFPQIRDVQKALPCGLLLYGRIALMVTDTCLVQGCGAAGGAGCRLPLLLRDRQGERFLVKRELACRNTLYNSKPVFLADKREDYGNLGLSFGSLYFTDESPQQAEAVLTAYLAGGAAPRDFTRGLYYKGVL